MNINKTLPYPVPLSAERMRSSSSIAQRIIWLWSWVLSSPERAMIKLDALATQEFFIERLVLVSTSIICLLFGLLGDSKYYYCEINIFQSTVALCFVLVTFTAFGQVNIKSVGNAFIYFINLSNVALIATSHFDDKISYQFIIYFFVSNLFFTQFQALYTSIVLITVSIIVISFLPNHNSTSISDFYIALTGCGIVLLLLMFRKFRIESQLAENESKYRLLAENSADIICTHRINGEFDFVSPSIFNLTGFTPEDLYGKQVSRFIYPEDRGMYISKLRNKDNKSVGEAFQYRFLTKGGKYIWLETVVKQITKSEEESQSRFLSQTRSFQRHHQYLEDIQRHSTELQSSYKDLEMFAYISSHDMQEPLRMISNYMQLLKRRYKDSLDSDAMEYIEFAVKGSSNLQALIKDLLSYSTINKKEITLSSVNMDELVHDVLSSIQLLLTERNVKVYINEPLLAVMGDKNALRQLVQNLITNGIKYNTSEVPVVRIFCIDNIKTITYCIQDNGIGIDQQYAQQIFEPFRRLHTKHNFPGTGLGLSICRKIIDRMNGKIWVESQLGSGSSFYFSVAKG